MQSTTLINLKSILEDQTGIDAADIDLLTTLESLGIDSLDKTELILTCEEAFAVEISEADADGILTVVGLYDCILRAHGVTL